MSKPSAVPNAARRGTGLRGRKPTSSPSTTVPKRKLRIATGPHRGGADETTLVIAYEGRECGAVVICWRELAGFIEGLTGGFDLEIVSPEAAARQRLADIEQFGRNVPASEPDEQDD